MVNSLIFDMPVELSLKFMSAVRSHSVDAKWELVDHVVDELTGVDLVVPGVDSQSTYTRCIIDRGVLVSPDSPLIFIQTFQELNINLNMMSRYLLFISLGVDLP